MTFSIVALDSSNGDLGVAVESKFLVVGVVVPSAEVLGQADEAQHPAKSQGVKVL